LTFAAATAGDDEAFERLTLPYTREIHVHCYRMLGSFHDAEDAAQETLLRAWKHLASLEDDGSFRAWLYRIATNVCLRQRAHRAKDPLMVRAALDVLTPKVSPPYNLSPYPDALLDDPLRVPRGPLREPQELEAPLGNPGAEYDLQQSVQLAFLAAVQLLPPRQRAVLILHDVVGFTGAEVANLLDSTIASVNSALNRARATLQQHRTSGRIRKLTSVSTSHAAESFVERRVAAWQAADVGQLAELLKADVVLGAPAFGLHINRRSAVCEFLAGVPALEDREKFRFIGTRANRQPAVAVYRLDEHFQCATYRALAMVVLTIDGEAAVGIAAFPDPTLMPVFELPTQV
jgi:RNA polymerase sigma-70 factor (ECF subfamily)